MPSDPVVEEMRSNFDKIAKRFDYDIDRLVEHFRREQNEHPERVVTHVPRALPEFDLPLQTPD